MSFLNKFVFYAFIYFPRAGAGVFFTFIFILEIASNTASTSPPPTSTTPSTSSSSVSNKIPLPLMIHKPLENIGDVINTHVDEFSPTLAPDASFMIFNSKRNSKYQNLYISYFNFKDNQWGIPVFLKELNSPYSDEAPTLSKDGSLLIFASDRDGSTVMPKDKYGRIKVSFDLYYSQKTSKGWSKPRKLSGHINTIHHERAPSLSADGKFLYYTMWRFGDMSQTVIMSAEFKDGYFINPKPMPSAINAGYRELALIQAENQKGFYFSSARPGGLGGWDIYYIAYESGKFGKPINLGDKINSPANDVFISQVDQLFLISSNRKNGKGRFDIYSTFIFDDQEKFETRAVHFDFNSPIIKQASYIYLNALVDFLKKKPQTNIDIIGHTDLHGSDEFNLTLSLKRAKAVKNYLVKQGINSSRITTKGMGKSSPLVNKKGPEFDWQNRRTEFHLSKIN